MWPTIAVAIIAQFVFYVRKIHTRVEVAGTQITTPAESAMICRLQDPKSGRSSSGIEQHAFALNQYKEVLKEVVRLWCILQNTVGYATNNPRVAMKQCRKSIVVTLGDKSDQTLV